MVACSVHDCIRSERFVFFFVHVLFKGAVMGHSMIIVVAIILVVLSVEEVNKF